MELREMTEMDEFIYEDYLEKEYLVQCAKEYGTDYPFKLVHVDTKNNQTHRDVHEHYRHFYALDYIFAYWEDEDGNRWLATEGNEHHTEITGKYTKEEAYEASMSLTDCTNCVNCTFCVSCNNLSNCHWCHLQKSQSNLEGVADSE